MNWFKMAKFNDWDELVKERRIDLGRDLTREEYAEIQQERFSRGFEDKYKTKEPVLADTKEWKDKIPGGNADGKSPKDFEKSQVERGKKVEFE